MMALMVWNIRGLTATKNKREVSRIVLEKEVEVMGVLEMKIRSGRHVAERGFFVNELEMVFNICATETGKGDSIWAI